MASEDYQDYIDHMSDILSRHPGLVSVSAHDYSLQLLEFEKDYQVVSGSIIEKEPTGKEPGELFFSSEYGYTKPEYFNSDEIRIGFFEFGLNESTEVYSGKQFFQKRQAGI